MSDQNTGNIENKNRMKKFWEDFCKCQPLFKKDADYASIEEGDAK